MIETLLADTARISLRIGMHYVYMGIIVPSVFHNFEALGTFDGLVPVGVVLVQGFLVLIRSITQGTDNIV